MKKFQKLTRNEMKNITGGKTGGPGQCTVGAYCLAVGPDPQTGHGLVTYPGNCDASCNCIGTGGSGQCTNS